MVCSMGFVATGDTEAGLMATGDGVLSTEEPAIDSAKRAFSGDGESDEGEELGPGVAGKAAYCKFGGGTAVGVVGTEGGGEAADTGNAAYVAFWKVAALPEGSVGRFDTIDDDGDTIWETGRFAIGRGMTGFLIPRRGPVPLEPMGGSCKPCFGARGFGRVGATAFAGGLEGPKDLVGSSTAVSPGVFVGARRRGRR